MKNKIFLILTCIVTLVAIGFHIYLTQKYYDLKFGQNYEASLCNVNDYLNCDAVTASEFSNLFGIPIALFGAATNGAFFLIVLFAIFKREEDEEVTLPGLITLMASTLAGVSVIMAIISTLMLSHLCLFCVATYICSFLGLGFVFAHYKTYGFSQMGGALKNIFTSQKNFLVTLLLIPALAYLVHISIHKQRGGNQIDILVKESYSRWQTGQEFTFSKTEGLIKESKKAAKLTLVEYADFLCPHCKHAAPTLHAFASSRNDVEFIFKAFPLDGACNPNIGQANGLRCKLAELVFCFEKHHQTGWRAHDTVFEFQTAIASGRVTVNDLIDDLAQDSKVDDSLIKKCIEDSETKDYIAKMVEEAQAAKISGTPTIFANGKKLMGGQQLPVLKNLYDKL